MSVNIVTAEMYGIQFYDIFLVCVIMLNVIIFVQLGFN